MRLNNKEIMHEYVHASGSDSGQASNVSFSGPELYSYNTCMCKKDYSTGKTIFLVNKNNYSPTTSKQMSYFWGALPHYFDRFEVNDPCGSAKDNAIDMFKDIQSKYNDLVYTNHKGKKARLTTEIEEDIDTLHNFMETFSVKFWSRKKVDKLLFNCDLGDELNESTTKAREAEQRRRKREEKKRLEILKERQAEAIEKYELLKQDWIDGIIDNINVPSSIDEVLCRIKDNEIQTSQRARMPIDEAKKLASDLLSGNVNPGKKYHHYKFVKYNKEELVIGCHHIKRDEVKRMIKLVLEY